MPFSFAFRPRIADALRGYDRDRFVRDLGAGATVGIVALPLAMAFAIASGLKPEAGLWTAIIAGFLISLLGGSSVQIGGPAGAFIVIVYGIVERYGAGQPADRHRLRRRAAVRHGPAAPGPAGALRAGEHRHRLHQRHRRADRRVAGQGLAGAGHRQDAGRLLRPGQDHRRAHRHLQPLRLRPGRRLLHRAAGLAAAVERALADAAGAGPAGPQARQRSRRPHPGADRRAGHADGAGILPAAAGGDHRQPLRRHPAAALPPFALPEFSWETVKLLFSPTLTIAAAGRDRVAAVRAGGRPGCPGCRATTPTRN